MESIRDVKIPLGGSSSQINVGGTCSVGTTSQVNSGSAETDLQTFSLPANTLLNVGDMLEIHMWGDGISNGNSKTVRIKFGTVTLQSISLEAGVANNWDCKFTIIKDGTDSQKYAVETKRLGSTLVIGFSAGNLGQPDSAAITIKATGQGGTSGDIAQFGSTIKFFPAP